MNLPPLDPCPYGKGGRHELGVVTPDDDDHDMTMFCTHCGTVRRVPVTGALSSLDDLDPAAIAEAVRHTRE